MQLHPAWLDAIDTVAVERLGRRDRVGAALAEEVRALSAVYNRREGGLRDQEGAHAARLRFFLPRDIPKIGGPLAELAHAGALPSGPAWRVLDLGAGLGTTGLGVASFAVGVEGVERLEVHAVERDAAALGVYADLAARCGRGVLAGVAVPMALTTSTADLEQLRPTGPFDLVVVGLALNELFAGASDPIAARADWLSGLSRVLAPGGTLIVLEPALRDVTRLLMSVRDRIEGQADGLGVFGPCTRGGACPLLRRERDWCHEVMDQPLPEPLRVIAKAAGLRWERLTYAALVLRNDDVRLGRGAYRVVGGPLESKGKVEWDLCGPAGLVRLARMDRHRGPDDPVGEAGRGALFELGDVTDGERVRTDKAQVRRVR